MRDDPFTHNDGRTVQLLRADGTIPIYYQGVKYNIPVKLHLPEGFPRTPPICYVTPTPNMIIKPGHAIVDGSGLVRDPYSHHWAYPRSSLAELATHLSEAFGREPPLFAKPAGYVPPPPPTHERANGGGGGAYPAPPPGVSGQSGPPGRRPPPPASRPSSTYPSPPEAASGRYPAPPPGVGGPGNGGSSGGGGGGGGGGLFGAAGRAHARDQQPPPPPPRDEGGARLGQYQQYNRVPFSGRSAETASGGGASGGGGQSLAEATFKSRAMHALTARLRVELATLQTQCAGEAERLLGVQAELADRRAAVDAALRDAKSEKTRWESRVGSLRAATVALKEWLGENEMLAAAAGGEANGNGEASGSGSGAGSGSGSGSAEAACDLAFAEEDVLSRQLLRAVARDAALEDAMDCLDEGLEKGRVTLDEYLRLTRNLCKEQFMARAEVLVVRKHQHQRGIVGGMSFERRAEFPRV